MNQGRSASSIPSTLPCPCCPGISNSRVLRLATSKARRSTFLSSYPSARHGGTSPLHAERRDRTETERIRRVESCAAEALALAVGTSQRQDLGRRMDSLAGAISLGGWPLISSSALAGLRAVERTGTPAWMDCELSVAGQARL